MNFLKIISVATLVTLFNTPGNALEDMNAPASAAAATAQHEIAETDILNENEKCKYIDICSEEPFGYQWAKEARFEGIMHGETYGYQEDKEQAHQLLDTWITMGDQWAKEIKLRGLNDGVYGYQRNKPQARQLLDDSITMGEPWAREAKLTALLYGYYGYQSSMTQAYEWIENCAEMGDQWARETKLKDLLIGHQVSLFMNHYECDKASRSEIESLLNMGSYI